MNRQQAHVEQDVAHRQHETQPPGGYPVLDPPRPAQQQQAGHGLHKWMMLLMCVPLLLLGVWQLTTGGGSRGLLLGLVCVAMMAVMHLAMGGHGRGGGHRH